MVSIRQASISNFQGLGDANLTLEGGAFLTGMNGSGKSSVLDAIRFALLQYCRKTDKGGRGAKALIADGADEAGITLDLVDEQKGQTVVVRVVIPRETPVRWIAEDAETGEPIATEPLGLWAWMGVKKATLAAALLPAEHVTSQGFGGVLSEFQAGVVCPIELQAHCGKPHIDALLEDYPAANGEDYPRQLTTLAGLRKVGKDAEAERTVVGRKVKALTAMPADVVDNPEAADGRMLTTNDIPKVKENIAGLRENRDGLMKELGEASQVSKVSTAGSVEDLRAWVKKAEEAEAAASESAQADRGDLNDAEDSAASITGRLSDIQEGIAKTHERITKLSAEIDGYSVGSNCDKCGAKWTEARVKKAKGNARSLRIEFSERLKNDEVLVKSLTADLKAARERVAEWAEKTRTTAADYEAARANTAQLRQDLELAERIGALRSPQAVETDIAKVDERITKAQAALDALAEVQAYQTKAKELANEKARYAELDWRVKAFRDGEVLNKLGGDSLKTFEVAVDAAVLPFGYAFALDIDGKAVTVKFGRRGGPVRPIELASDGERKLFEIAVATTFAEDTGFALIDDLDCLDGRNRNVALSVIREVIREHQIIAAGAWGKPTEPETLGGMARALEPLRVIWLGGTAKQAQAAA